MKPGGRVRVTLGDSAVVGEVVYCQDGVVDVQPDGAGALSFPTPPWTVEVLAPAVPAWMLEPGAVCKDTGGVLWERSATDCWESVGWTPRCIADLGAQRGPLTRLVPVPLVPEDVQKAARGVVGEVVDYSEEYALARWVLDLAGVRDV